MDKQTIDILTELDNRVAGVEMSLIKCLEDLRKAERVASGAIFVAGIVIMAAVIAYIT